MLMFTGIKDVDLEILSRLDADSQINFSLTCKYANSLFNDRKLWINKIIKNFPTFYQYSDFSPQFKWKEFYFSILKDFYKLLGFYIYSEFEIAHMDVYELFLESIKFGIYNIVRFFVHKKYINLLEDNEQGIFLSMAAMKNHLNIIKYFCDSGCNNYHGAIQTASFNKNIEVLKYFINERSAEINRNNTYNYYEIQKLLKTE